MNAASRPTISRLAASSSSRHIATSSIRAAAAKGKAPKSAAPQRKAANSFAKKPQQASAGGAGGGRSGGGGGVAGITLRYSEARPPADLSDWPRLHPEILSSSTIGKPTTFPPDSFSSIQQFGLPRRIDKELSDSSGAVSVIRQSTVDLANRLDRVRRGDREGISSSLTLAGERGSGKSMLLLQTVTHALNTGWIALYVPRSSEWINSTTAYTYHPASQTFHQPALASSLLSKLLSVNKDLLSRLKTGKSLQVEGQDVSEGTGLVELIQMGMRGDEPGLAVPILEAVIEELSTQTEIPFLIAIDEAQSLFTRTTYKTPTSQPIQSYNLAIPRFILSTLSTLSPSPSPSSSRKSQTILSLSYSTPSFPPSLTLLHALNQPTGSRHPITPYTDFEPGHLSFAQGLEVYNVAELGKAEAGGMFEVYAKKGWGGKGDEPYLSSLISSGGNPLEFGRGLSRSLTALA